MIEVRTSLEELKRNPHETIINIKLVELMRNAGIPVVGKMIPSAIERGTLVWFTEEDLDGDTHVIQWYAPGEFSRPVPVEDEL